MEQGGASSCNLFISLSDQVMRKNAVLMRSGRGDDTTGGVGDGKATAVMIFYGCS